MDRRQVYGGPRPPFSSLSVVHVHRVHVRVAGEGNFPCFLSRRAPTDGERPMSLASGAGAQLKRLKAPPSLGVFVGGVNTACGVPWCADHGGGLPSTTAASVRWLRPR